MAIDKEQLEALRNRGVFLTKQAWASLSPAEKMSAVRYQDLCAMMEHIEDELNSIASNAGSDLLRCLHCSGLISLEIEQFKKENE